MSSSPILHARILEEPELIFGGEYPASDPKTGLSLYGPYSSSRNIVKVGIIGDKDTITQTRSLFEVFHSPVEGDIRYPLWIPDFPGISNDSPLQCDFNFSERWYQSIGSIDLESLAHFTSDQEKISESVNLFVRKLKNLREQDESPDVVICAPPRSIMDLCVAAQDRIFRKRSSPKERIRPAKRTRYPDVGQETLIVYVPEYEALYGDVIQERAAENFHHLLKARAMKFKIPTQMILPYTLEAFHKISKKRLQHDSTLAWNLCVAILYKAETRPWRLAHIENGTCYVGISFYREKQVFGGHVGVSLAQVFTPEGEGLVLRGERFDWPGRGQTPRLSSESSQRLLEKALAHYQSHTAQWPRRVVIHKSSIFDEAEIRGFSKALENVPRRDFVAILAGSRRIKLFRQGEAPILRGTMIELPESGWLLYTKAYIPYLRVYPGPRVPRPLEIVQHIGDTPIDVVLKEILGLCKLNWNSSDFTSFLPITLQFSRQVGTILRELHAGVVPETKYLYYM